MDRDGSRFSRTLSSLPHSYVVKKSPSILQAPVPIRLWKGIFNAQNYGRKCPTLEDLLKLTENELRKTDVEDCLNMAIYSKNVRSTRQNDIRHSFLETFRFTFQLNASNPVMVFIHGGGFVSGSVEQYPPNYLLEGDIILVVIQFRLSVLGNFSVKLHWFIIKKES